MKIKEINIFALAALGKGLSGGDRIFIEFARRWSKDVPINIYLWTEGREMCSRQNLESSKIQFKISSIKPWCGLGFVICYLARIVEGVKLGLTIKLKNKRSTVVYSASEFWMDSLPAFILKLRYPRITWMAAWYQTAPNPLKGYKEGGREASYRLPAFYFWFMQQPIKPLVKKWADFVLVNNQEERKQFPRFAKAGRTVVVYGAVPLSDIKIYLNRKPKIENRKKEYDAVFQGRFHPQKGVIELVDIWKKVVEEIPNAKLAMIGGGALRKEVELRIKNHELGGNVKLFGYVFDGDKKYSIFHKSKIVVHPAFYDSGGMAAAEAMAFGLPCVGFDLKSYKSYYPKGMIKVKIGDTASFAVEVIKLLSNVHLRKRVGEQALRMIESYWSWDKRAWEVLDYVKNFKK